MTYSVNFAEIAQLEQLIPTMVSEIRRRAAKIKPKNDTKELGNTKAILDSLYLKGKKD